MKDQFKEYSYYYDLLYLDKDYEKESEYIHSILKRHSCSVNKILNLGCGTGKHDIIFAQKGYDITGVDLSETMIRKAKINALDANLDINFLHGDLRNIKLDEKYDCILSLFHVLSYQNSNQDAAAFFNTAKKHLKPDGIFIFDFWYGPGVLNDIPKVRVKRFENEELELIRIAEPVIHYERNVVDVKYELIVTEKESQQSRKLNETHSMRYFFDTEIELFINKSFKIDKIVSESWQRTYILSMKDV